MCRYFLLVWHHVTGIKHRVRGNFLTLSLDTETVFAFKIWIIPNLVAIRIKTCCTYYCYLFWRTTMAHFPTNQIYFLLESWLHIQYYDSNSWRRKLLLRLHFWNYQCDSYNRQNLFSDLFSSPNSNNHHLRRIHQNQPKSNFDDILLLWFSIYCFLPKLYIIIYEKFKTDILQLQIYDNIY